MRYSQLFESPSINYSIMPGEKFYRELFPQGDTTNARARLKYLSNYNDQDSEIDFVAKDGDLVVGVAGCHMDTRDEERVMSIWFLSVDPTYRNQGIAKQLADNVFKYAHEKNLRVRSSSYTEMGQQFLKAAFEALAKKYGVPFKDGNDHYRFDYVKESIVTEMLDAPPEIEIIKQRPKEFLTQSTINGRAIRFTALAMSGMWGIAFYDHSGTIADFSSNGKGGELETFAMVKASMAMFIKDYDPEYISFDASKSDKSRAPLYARMVKKYLAGKYELSTSDSKSSVSFLLRKVNPGA